MPTAKEFVIWDDKYNVGIGFMDDQHQKLVGFTNELHKGVFALEHDGYSKSREESFKEGVRAAVDYVKVHFAAEEELMRSMNYPKYAEHKGHHEEFVRRVLQDVARFGTGDKRVGMQFVYFLRDWLLEHIAIVDKEMSAYAKSKGIK